MAISKQKRDKIVQQALNEISFARKYKQGKTATWQKNEDLYYNKKTPTADTRANMSLGRMQEYVHTLLSKIDAPLVFKFKKRKESQYKRVQRLNALREIDSQNDDWDIKDLAGKKQAAIYGRAIYSYYADSRDGYYCAHLENVDVYDFLIDPSAGGLDVERARFIGDYGVVLDRSDLRQGVKDGLYLSYEVSQLLGGDGNSTEQPREELNKRNRSLDTNIIPITKEIGDLDKFKFWRWGTTFEGERYYLLLTERGATAIRVEKVSDVFPATARFPKGAWWYWTWAAFLDLTEFWTPSYCDYVREMLMGQEVSINQQIDNSEEINKPQRVVNVGAVENLAQVKYRREGQIHVKKDFDATKVIQELRPPAINAPLEVFNVLEDIIQKASGVTAAAEGAEKVNGKVGIYQGNQENSSDRFGLLNKSYAFGYKRFAKLYELGVRDNLTKKVAVDMIGPEGIETEEITRRDIFYKNDEFGVLIEASNAEEQTSEQEQERKAAFLERIAANPVLVPIINPKKLIELDGQVSGISDEDIKQLLDTSEYGNAEILSEAERDIEYLLDGKQVKPNRGANLAYKQRFYDYLADHEDDLDFRQHMLLVNYITLLEPIVMQNTARELANKTAAMGVPPANPMGAPMGQPASNPLSNNPQPNGQVPVPALGA